MTACPKCHYERKPTDTAPDWQCPSCGIAYAKYHPAPATAPAPGVEHAPAVASSPGLFDEGMDWSKNRGAGVFWALVFILPGLWFILAGFRHGNDPGWVDGRVIAAFGTLIALLGYVLLVRVFQWGAGALRAGGNVAALCLGAIVNYAVFLADPGGWSGDRIVGSFSKGHVARLIATSISLYSLIALVEHAWRKEESKKHFVPGFLAVALALSVVLHATGTLDRIDAALGQPQLGPLVTRGPLRVYRRNAGSPDWPLNQFAGAWKETRPMVIPGFGIEWVKRAEVRIENGKAIVRLWRGCPQGLCDIGAFTAEIQTRTQGRAQSLDLDGQTAGMDWIVSLTPDRARLQVEERHIRGTSWGTHQQKYATLERER